jgi:hypothetical protein
MGRKKFVMAAAAVGMLAAMAPAASAGAASHGSNPHAKICSLAKSELAGNTKQEVAIETAIESGNWPKAQKSLLSVYNNGAKLESQAEAALSSAPGKVKSAGKTLLGLDTAMKKAIQSATSATQFETSIESLTESPKYTSAENVLDKYDISVCGPITTPTTTPAG